MKQFSQLQTLAAQIERVHTKIHTNDGNALISDYSETSPVSMAPVRRYELVKIHNLCGYISATLLDPQRCSLLWHARMTCELLKQQLLYGRMCSVCY